MIYIVLIVLSFLSVDSIATTRVIYGEDSRREIFELEDVEVIRASYSVATRVHKEIIRSEDGKSFKIFDDKVSDEFGIGLCLDEKYSNQSTIGNCSGFLVGEDLLVTAGHCFAEEGELIVDQNNFFCSDFDWVFDFKMKDSNKLAIDLREVPKDSIYSCSNVIYAANFDNIDIALIKLKRKTKNREPLKFDMAPELLSGQGVYMLGHPLGLPMKYAADAEILGVEEFYFRTNLDSFGGNSGSPIFDKETQKVIGLAVRGRTDFIKRQLENSTCEEVNTCDYLGENCRVEEDEISSEHASLMSLLKGYL